VQPFNGILFCIHGFLGQASDWELTIPLELRWKSIDLFSKEALVPSPLDFRSFGEAIQKNVGDLPCPRVLVGYSLGGRIALHMLVEKPEIWSAAVIIGAHPGLSDEGERLRRIDGDERWAKRFEVEEWDTVLSDWNSQTVLIGSPNIERKESDFSRKTLADSLRGCSLGKQKDLREQIGKLRLPILWIVGEEDLKFLSIAKQLKKLNPRITLVVIPKAGHRAPWDQPEFFKKCLIEFLTINES